MPVYIYACMLHTRICISTVCLQSHPQWAHRSECTSEFTYAHPNGTECTSLLRPEGRSLPAGTTRRHRRHRRHDPPTSQRQASTRPPTTPSAHPRATRDARRSQQGPGKPPTRRICHAARCHPPEFVSHDEVFHSSWSIGCAFDLSLSDPLINVDTSSPYVQGERPSVTSSLHETDMGLGKGLGKVQRRCCGTTNSCYGGGSSIPCSFRASTDTIFTDIRSFFGSSIVWAMTASYLGVPARRSNPACFRPHRLHRCNSE